MERFTQLKILQKYAKYLEITSWICNNDLSAFLRCLWVKTYLSKVRQHRLYDLDRSLYFVLCHLEDKYRTRDCICQYCFVYMFRIFVCILW